jgi:hypothetical protein
MPTEIFGTFMVALSTPRGPVELNAKTPGAIGQSWDANPQQADLAEAGRQAAEKGREFAETERDAGEERRGAAEKTRVSAEEARSASDEARHTRDETLRILDEARLLFEKIENKREAAAAALKRAIDATKARSQAEDEGSAALAAQRALEAVWDTLAVEGRPAVE